MNPTKRYVYMPIKRRDFTFRDPPTISESSRPSTESLLTIEDSNDSVIDPEAAQPPPTPISLPVPFDSEVGIPQPTLDFGDSVMRSKSSSEMVERDDGSTTIDKPVNHISNSNNDQHKAPQKMEEVVSPNKKIKRDHRYTSPLAATRPIESYKIVNDLKVRYTAISGTVHLLFPSTDFIEVFPLCRPLHADEYSPIDDLCATISFISLECLRKEAEGSLGSIRHGVLRAFLKAFKIKDIEGMAMAVIGFNDCLEQLKEDGWCCNESVSRKATPAFLAHILDQSFFRTVALSSKLLTRYKPFSNNVYGEVNANFVTNFIEKTKLNANSVFLDMGSGIGNVVLQVAGQCICDSYGIEIMKNPSDLAMSFKTEFLSRMRLYGKPTGRIFLKEGDFLLDESIQPILAKADVIFVNNYVFEEELNQNLLLRFLDLKESALVVSLKSFALSKSARSINSMESIFTVAEHKFPNNGVSWMANGGSYYIHTVKRRVQ